MSPVRLLLAIAAATWLLLLLTAPLATLGGPVSGATYLFGSFICHQRPDRSFHVAGAQLPVCARCFGLYAGAALVFVFALRADLKVGRSGSLRSWLLVAAMPTALIWGAEVAGLWNPGNALRFAAALPLGAAAAVTVNYGECARTRRSGSRRPPTPI